MTKSIAEIEAELAAAKKAAIAEAEAEADAIWAAKTYDYSVDWNTRRGLNKPASQFVFKCTKALSPETKAAMDAFDEKYPTGARRSTPYVPRPWSNSWSNGGSMEYILIGNLMTHTGGGTLVLKGSEEDGGFSHEPIHLTDIEAQSLRNGKVPDSLKR